MAKLFASETYVKAANTGMQIFGGFGYNMEFDMQRHYRDARVPLGCVGRRSAFPCRARRGRENETADARAELDSVIETVTCR